MTAAERDTGDAILRAAANLFAERGYKGTTTRSIAERAGVNEVTVFRRFGNKQGVLTALGEMWARRMAGFAVTAMPDPADTRATLRALAALEVLQAKEFGVVALRLALDAVTNPEIAAVMGGGPGENFAGLVTYLAERQKAGDLRPDMDPRVMAEAFFALTSQTVMSRQALGGVATYELSVDDAAGQLLELYMDGISARRAS